MAESAAFARRGHSGAAKDSVLASGITAAATTLDGVDLSTWTGTITDGPSRATLSDGTNEEEIEFTGVSSNTLTGITRGVGDTAAQAWNANTTTISQTSSKRDYDEANLAVVKTLGQVSGNGGKFYKVNAGATDIEVVTLSASHMSDLAEFVRDTIGTALTEGSNIDLTVNDAGDTITLAVTGTLGSVPSEFNLAPGAWASIVGSPSLADVRGDGYMAGWLFDAASTELIQASLVWPTGWATADVEVWWVNCGAGAGNVRGQLSRHNGDMADGASYASGTSTQTTIAAPSGTNVKKVTMASGISCTPGELTWLQVGRVGADGADTLANDAAIVSVVVRKAS